MPCYQLRDAWRPILSDGTLGTVQFNDRNGQYRYMQLPCGSCIGCRLDYSRQWAARAMHESQMHKYNCSLLLTYNEENNPYTLTHKHIQDFLKRTRASIGTLRYYMCGEYGEKLGRPHYHLILYGQDFHDKVYLKTTDAGSRLYTSAKLTQLWPHGHATVGDVTYETAAYIAQYITKKITGKKAHEHYVTYDKYTGEQIQIEPEYTEMSLKPGLGQTWLEKYESDVYNRDKVIINGSEMKTPRYYDTIIKKKKIMQDIEHNRQIQGANSTKDKSPKRQAVREAVATAKYKQTRRNTA